MGDEEAPVQVEMGNEVPAEDLDGMSKLDQILSQHSELRIHQKLNLLEAVTQGCCEQQNGYHIMAADDESLLLDAKEVSNGCARCCCAPLHSTMVYIHDPQTKENLLTLERPGCAFPMPQKFLGCCICCDSCKDGLTVYEGEVMGQPGDLQGPPPPLFSFQQQMFGGGCRPKIDVFTGKAESSSATHVITGPACWGGCSELCCVNTYTMDNAQGRTVAEVVHLTPKTLPDVVKEICTDTDKFKVSFQNCSLTEKKTALSAAFLLDYMFFEMDNGMLACKGFKQLDITCFFCFCFGCICPCKISLQKGEGGGGPATE